MSYCKYKKNCLKRRKGEIIGAQSVKGAVRLLRVVDGVTRTAYGSQVQLTGVTRHNFNYLNQGKSRED